MADWAPKRFWTSARTAPADGGVQVLLDDKPIRQTIGEKQQQLLDRSDLLLQVGPRSWGQQWKSIVQEAEASKDAVGDSREEQLIHRFGKALRNFRLGLVGARIDGGLSINKRHSSSRTAASE